jgi:ATP-binding cassette subfamily B protein
VLTNLDFEIPKGSRIGLIGATGGGKSTLLDVIMGLLPPTRGAVEIDGQSLTVANRRSWQANIAHVPQAIYLADTTIEENIALGVPNDQIDRERVRLAARRAHIAETIESWTRGYKTQVGERGISLSGGQRQRIGIARALYKHANVIVLDEATSALDDATQEEVMKAMDELSDELTLIIVAHRLTTLRHCTRIIELEKGTLARNGNYEEFIGTAARKRLAGAE